MSDQQLERGIVECVKARQIPGVRWLHVEARQGVAVLRGQVASDWSRRLCFECCRHVTGVVRVVDELEVSSG